MPFVLRRFGRNIARPGVLTRHDLSGLTNLDLGAESAVLVIGEASAGEPQAASTSPVVHEFTDPQDMIDMFISGNLAECSRFLFDPVMAGQQEVGAPITGCAKVYAIKTNQSTQGSYTLQDASANNALTLKGRIWGDKDNQTWFKVETSGTGITLTNGRDVDPDTGDQTSITFSITGTDEWFSVTTTGNFTGASCTLDFDGTTFTLDSNVALEDLAITAAGKTVEEVIGLINAFNPHGTGAVYQATLNRTNRNSTLSSYCDETAAPVSCFSPAVANISGVSYDIVDWVNTSSYYCEATWVGGYEPQTYTKTYLTGGASGATSNISYVQDALKVAAKLSIRYVVSAYHTDVNAGAITLASINSEFNTHAVNCNLIGSPRERQVFLCNDDTTKAAMYTTVSAFNNEYIFCFNNRIQREDENGTKKWMNPHVAACAAAATMAGSPIATPLTHKYIKGYDHDFIATDFDDTADDDFENAIRNGLCFIESEPDIGLRFAKGITTYTLEDNDARTAGEVVEARNRMRILLRRALDQPEIGHKNQGARTAVGIRQRVLNALRLMANPNDPDFILVDGTDADGNVVPAYRNIRVSIDGSVVNVTGEVTFTQGIVWIVNDFRATLPSALV